MNELQLCNGNLGGIGWDVLGVSMAVAMQRDMSQWRLFFLGVGLLYCCLKAADSPLVQAIQESAAIGDRLQQMGYREELNQVEMEKREEVNRLIETADETALRAAVLETVNQAESIVSADILLESLLNAGEYDQDLLSDLLAKLVLKTFFWHWSIETLVGKGVLLTAEQKARILQTGGSLEALRIALEVKDSQWAQELVQTERIENFGSILLSLFDVNSDIFQQILPHALQENLNSAFPIALQSERNEIVALLKTAGARLEGDDSPLVQAIRDRTSINEIKMLIQAADEASLLAALLDVVQKELDEFNSSVLSALLSTGKYNSGMLRTALIVAGPERRKSRLLVQTLIEKGAWPTAEQRAQIVRDFGAETALDFAVSLQDRSWVNNLIQNQEIVGFGDFLVRNFDQYRDLFEAILFDESFEWSDVSLNNLDNALIEALKSEKDELVEDLYRADANPLVGVKYASEKKNRDLLQYIFEQGLISFDEAIEYAREAADDWLRISSESLLTEVNFQLPESEVLLKVSSLPSLLPSEKAAEIDTSLRHFPVLFLIEQSGGGGIRTQPVGERVRVSVNEIDAGMNQLWSSLLWDRRLIIASKGLTCGLLALLYTRDEYDAVRRVANAEWKLYSVPDTQFTIWIHNDYAEYYAQILNIDRFQQLLTSTKEEVLRYCPSVVVSEDDPRIQIEPYDVQDLEKIFKPKVRQSSILEAVERQETINLEKPSGQELKQAFAPEQPDVLDVFVFGHGLSGELMAGLPVSQGVDEHERITSLLTFLSKKVNTGIVYVESCSAGGRNATLLQTSKDGIPLDYNYILVIGAIDDKLITDVTQLSLLLKDRFFTQAGQIERNGKALDSFFKDIIAYTPRVVTSFDVQGYAAFPQVWLPGNVGFQTPNVHKDVLAVGKVTAAVHGQSDRELLVKDRMVVLWYPKVVTATVSVLPITVDRLGEHDVWMQDMSTWVRMLAEGKKTEFYPEFISMDRKTPRRLWFKKVKLSGASGPLMGILRFLRDAFFHVGSESKDIFIEELEGINDFVFHMQVAREKEHVNQAYPLEELMQSTSMKRISLQNVMVRVNSPEYPEEIMLYIEYGGQYWSYRLRIDTYERTLKAVGPGIWHFRETEAPQIEEFKKSLTQDIPPAEQKTAYEVTKKKLERLKRGMGPEQWTEFKGRLYPKLPKGQPAPAAK